MSNKNKSDLVLSYLRKEQTCYNKLVTKMKEQKQAITEGNESELLAIIQENDELIETIQKLDQEIERVFNTIPKAQRKSMIQQVGTLKDQIQDSLREVIALENACRGVLESKKAGVRDQMKTLKTRKTLAGKYQSTIFRNSFFSKNA